MASQSKLGSNPDNSVFWTLLVSVKKDQHKRKEKEGAQITPKIFDRALRNPIILYLYSN